MKPAIVVIAFNRPKSLNNVLISIANADYLIRDIPLVISVDYHDSKEHDEVLKIARDFNWSFGKKQIIEHTQNLGLKEHVLSCGDLTKEYGSVIMLEDDLFVSPYYYGYSKNALNYYENDERIAGVSLYNHKKNFLNQLPFELIPDSYDVYFLQVASSWGQAWTKKQWLGFRTWFKENEILSELVPTYIRNWPGASWLKHFINYLVVTNKYFVYPNKSLTTNFGDSGTNNRNKNTDFQVPIFLGNKFSFIALNKSFNVYDSFFELSPSTIKKLNPVFKQYDFSVDLYGLKPLGNIKSEYIISSKRLSINPDMNILSFGLELKPMVFNLVFKIEGFVFKLNKTSSFVNEIDEFNFDKFYVFDFFVSKFPFKKSLKIFLAQLKSKFKKK